MRSPVSFTRLRTLHLKKKLAAQKFGLGDVPLLKIKICGNGRLVNRVPYRSLATRTDVSNTPQIHLLSA